MTVSLTLHVTEKQLQQRAVRYAKNNGWLAYKWESPGTSGVPDYIFIKGGKVVMVEFKSSSGVLSPFQEYQISILRAEGMSVHVINSFDAFVTMLKKAG